MSPEQRQQVADRVLRARIRLALQQPFLATALMRLPVREVHGLAWCPTAATDGYHIFYNPQWVKTLRDTELRGLLAHEVLHVLFTHAERRQQRDGALWNMACDYAINWLLTQRGFKLPAGGLLDERAQDKTSEQIYTELESLWSQMQAKAGKGAPSAKGSTRGKAKGSNSTAVQSPWRLMGGSQGRAGSVEQRDTDDDEVPAVGADLVDPQDPRVRPLRSADAPDPEQLEGLRQELRQDAMARLKGEGAGAFSQECGAARDARLDWRALLRAWLADRIKGDWSSFPFSKRMLHRGLYLPSAGMQVPAHVVFAIDTSGSMPVALVEKIVAELRAFREVFPSRLSVVQCDAKIQAVEEYEAMDGFEIPASLQIHGRGGTDFRPLFEWTERHAPSAVVLYATDGLGDFPAKAPACPVIWLYTPMNSVAAEFPFGAVVRVAQ